MDTIRFEIITNDDRIADKLKENHVRFTVIAGVYTILIPVCVEVRFTDLLYDIMEDLKATAMVNVRAPMSDVTGPSHGFMEFINGVEQ